MHNVFQVSILRKHLRDKEQDRVTDMKILDLREDLSYVMNLVRILDSKAHKLRYQVISLVKVFWSQHDESNSSWEKDDDLCHDYPFIFNFELCV